MRIRHVIGGAIVIIAGSFAYANYIGTQPVSSPAPQYDTQPANTQSANTRPTNRSGPDEIYPPAWATGELDVDTSGNTGQTICNRQWSTKSIRPPVSYTNSLKIQQLKQLGYADQNPKDYEEDHLCSLEIGGSPTSTHNLWPEPYSTSIPDGGAKTKDSVENALHGAICAQQMTPQEACHILVSDWYAYYLAHVKTQKAGTN